MNNLQKRILTAIIGIPIIVVAAYRGGMEFLFLVFAISALGEIEFFSMVERKIDRRFLGAMIVLTLLMSFGAYKGVLFFMGCVTFSLLLWMSFILFTLRKRVEDFMGTVSVYTFIFVYFGLFFNHSILLRNVSTHVGSVEVFGSITNGNDLGFFFLILTIGCTFLNDTGAYAVGRLAGKHKLIPSLSPGKTWEGSIGGFLLCVITSFLINSFFGRPISNGWSIIFGVVIALSAIVGDLFESGIKRSVGVKDSGSLLPGHGGILDRFDSLFFVFPFSYYLVLIFYYVESVEGLF